MRLTKTSAARLQADGRDRVVWDDTLSGFGVRVTKAGSKLFLVQYKAQGRNRRVSLGKMGVLTVDQARKQARSLLGRVAVGEDPWLERHQARGATLTFGDLVARYFEEHGPKLKPRSFYVERRGIEKHILPLWKRRRLDEITRTDVERLHRRMKGTPSEANHTLGRVHALYNWARARDLYDGDNPARHVRRYPEKPRERYLTTGEYDRLARVLADLEGERPHWRVAVEAIRMLALTGCRRNEILGLRWADVDLERGFLNLKDAKSGGRAVFITDAAIEMLERQPREGEYVFPNWKFPGKPLTRDGLGAAWGEARKRSDLDGVRLHDLRHSYASVLAAQGVSLPIIGALLGHRKAQTTARYVHLSDDPVREAAAKAQGRIGAALEGKAAAPVVRIGR